MQRVKTPSGTTRWSAVPTSSPTCKATGDKVVALFERPAPADSCTACSAPKPSGSTTASAVPTSSPAPSAETAPSWLSVTVSIPAQSIRSHDNPCASCFLCVTGPSLHFRIANRVAQPVLESPTPALTECKYTGPLGILVEILLNANANLTSAYHCHQPFRRRNSQVGVACNTAQSWTAHLAAAQRQAPRRT